MSIRVHAFARKINASVTDILAKCREKGWEVTNNFSGLNDEQVSELTRLLGGAVGAPHLVQRAEAAPAPPAERPKRQAPPPAPAVSAAPPPAAGPRPARGAPPPKAGPERPSGARPAEARRPGPEAPAPPAGARPRRHGEETPALAAEEPPARHAVVAKLRRHVEKPEAAEEAVSRPARPPAPRISTRTGRLILSPEANAAPPGAYGTQRFVPPSTVQRSSRRGRRSRRHGPRHVAPAQQPRATRFELTSPVTVRSFSEQTGIRANLLIRKLMDMGQMVRINDSLSQEVAELLGVEFGFEVVVKEKVSDLEEQIAQAARQPDKEEERVPRAPIVTFLGHVDHGKTTLLDAIRKTSVAAGEAGGITQHIGAYRADFPDGKKVVFLDTPGHEAFTAMRARGANVTDIAVLVVAADDGVMQQTEEAINHAKAANVPILVAINKCDRPEANPTRVKQQIAALGLLPEGWGGETVCVEVSALTGAGVDSLVEMIALLAEMRELKSNPGKNASGTVLDAHVQEGRGIVASIVVQDGTLHRGDHVAAGPAHGRAKAMFSDRGVELPEAGPSTPMELLGLDVLPTAGDHFYVVDEPHLARAAAEQRRDRDRLAGLTRRKHVSLEDLFSTLEAGEARELRVIFKGDVKGTLEALDNIVGDLRTPEVSVRVLHSGVGAINTSDVHLADASDAVIVGLTVAPSPEARALAEEKGVEIRTYSVIYHAKEELTKALEGLLEPEKREVIQGHAEVLQLFKSSRYGVIAGCAVRDGVVTRGGQVRVIRDGVVVHTGRILSIRREKDDAREAREGFECGIKIENYDDVKVGDRFEGFVIEKVRRTLDDAGLSGGSKRP